MALLLVRHVLALTVLLLGVVDPAAAVLRVVATTPDVADMTRQIGGDRVEVVAIARGNQDPHKVPVKPSFVTKLNRADAVVVNGLGLEHAFLPALLEVANNPKILPGGPAYIDASAYIQPLEVPSSQNRAQGELHPLGNPHFNLDPVRGKLMARAIAEVDWDDVTEFAPAVVTMIAMPLTFSIATGIGFGFITYAAAKAVTGQFDRLNAAVVVLGVAFALKFAIVA